MKWTSTATFGIKEPGRYNCIGREIVWIQPFGKIQQLIHSSPQLRQSNGSYPFAQGGFAASSLRRRPLSHPATAMRCLSPELLLTTEPLSFNCNIQLLLSNHKARFLSTCITEICRNLWQPARFSNHFGAILWHFVTSYRVVPGFCNKFDIFPV